MTLRHLSVFCVTAALGAQPLDPAKLTKPPTDSWPTYNGDYSGRRYSPLSQITTGNAGNLSLAWARRVAAGVAGGGAIQIKATPLMVNGVLYFAAPDHAWALDARSGRELWHYRWETKGGIHIGNRGFGMYGDWLFFETPDCYLVSLDAKTGRLRWSQQIADVKQEYFCTPAPMIIRNHVIVGVGGDSLDVPGYLESRDPETGNLQWRWNTTPRPGEPNAETWPNRDTMEHGGGMTWLSGTYDPELNLYYFGTGNPQPVLAGHSRAGDNLYTASIIALNPDTGKMAWYFQASPHDTHDWDNVGTPVLIDGQFGGRQRKMLAQAARNGHFIVLDRTNGQNLLTAPFIGTVNWIKEIDAKGRPIPEPKKEPQPDGTLVSPAEAGAANWFAPSFNPDTGLFYTHATEAFAVYWLTDVDQKPEGWGGRNEQVWSQNLLQAIDYKTGKIAWSHRYPNLGGNRSGVLSTAGNLLFGGDPTGNAVAFDARNGRILWHAGLHAAVSNGPITYELDGRQYVVFGAGDMLYSFTLPR
jgi:alcohol dehydrogenase (cytochrome c)